MRKYREWGSYHNDFISYALHLYLLDTSDCIQFYQRKLMGEGVGQKNETMTKIRSLLERILKEIIRKMLVGNCLLAWLAPY